MTTVNLIAPSVQEAKVVQPLASVVAADYNSSAALTTSLRPSTSPSTPPPTVFSTAASTPAGLAVTQASSTPPSHPPVARPPPVIAAVDQPFTQTDPEPTPVFPTTSWAQPATYSDLSDFKIKVSFDRSASPLLPLP